MNDIKGIIIREFVPADCQAAHTLWRTSKGVCNCDKCMELDSRPRLETFLKRNPGLSFIAEKDQKAVGTVLAGHDGRTGIIYRLTVSDDLREKGIGRALVEKAVEALRREGITIVKAFVLSNNHTGNAFWERIGFAENDIAITRAKKI